MSVRQFLTLVLLFFYAGLGAQFWYLDIMTVELKSFKKGGERFAESGMLAVAKRDSKDLVYAKSIWQSKTPINFKKIVIL